VEEVVVVEDSWEDLLEDTPTNTPAASPTAASGAGAPPLHLPAAALPSSPARGILPRPKMELLIEEDEVRTSKTAPTKLSSLVEDRGDVDEFVRQKSTASVGSDEDAVRSKGTPVHCPRSPARQQALANLGLIDDLDLNEGEEAKLDAADIDAAFDAAAKPEAPPTPTVSRTLTSEVPTTPVKGGNPDIVEDEDEDDDAEESEEEEQKEEDDEEDEAEQPSSALPGDGPAKES